MSLSPSWKSECFNDRGREGKRRGRKRKRRKGGEEGKRGSGTEGRRKEVLIQEQDHFSRVGHTSPGSPIANMESCSGWSWLRRPSGEVEWAAEPRAPGGTEGEDGSSQSSTAALMTVWCQTGPTALPTLASPAAPCQLKMSGA